MGEAKIWDLDFRLDNLQDYWFVEFRENKDKDNKI